VKSEVRDGGYTYDDLDWLRDELGVARTRKLDDYRLGGAGVYVLVDLPRTGAPTFEVHDFGTGEVTTATGTVDLIVAGRPLRFDLTNLR
jgi:hypothetical protein